MSAPEEVASPSTTTLIQTPPAADRPKVGVACFITKKVGDEVYALLGMRLSSLGANKLQLPGGHLEYGESWEECASRETAEETGYLIPITSISFFTVTNDVFTDDRKHYITIFMRGVLSEEQVNDDSFPQVLEPEKCAWWKWYKISELTQLEEDSMFLPLWHLVQKLNNREVVVN